jgi:hypothetical protein
MLCDLAAAVDADAFEAEMRARRAAFWNAQPFTYYTGAEPHHLNHSSAPLFVSSTRLARYTTAGDAWPVRTATAWAGDSGAYTAHMGNNPGHPWHASADVYGGMWVRFMEECGRQPDFVAPQDWPCEPGVRARTGYTVRDHQELTVWSYLHLTEEFPMVPWLPVLQGWTLAEYVDCADMYERAGVQLADMPRVGLGSVCRRGAQTDVAAIVTTLAARGYRLHGFGVSLNALRLVGHLLASADSQAWSATARAEGIRLEGCTHTARDGVTPTDCRNCFAYAMTYRAEVEQALMESATARARAEQLSLFDLAAA